VGLHGTLKVNEPVDTYLYKASLIGSAHRFELTEDRLAWHVSGRSGLWPYTDIASVRLSYRPISMQPRRFRADIHHVNGARISLLSTTWTTVTLMAPQDRDYRAFITQLHRRLKEAGSKTELVGGLRPVLHHAAVAIGGLLIRALSTGEWAGALFLIGFAALFWWQIGGFVTRNRPQRYTFDALPEQLLP
jgi:hypothetical protein